MSEVLNIYFSSQVLLTLAYLMVWLLKSSTTKYDFSFLLRFSYFLMTLSIFLPIIYHLLPGENPFGPIVKVWSESGATSSGTQVASQLRVHIPSNVATPSVAWGGTLSWGVAIASIIFGYIFYGLAGLFKSYIQLKQLKKKSLLFKKIGRTNIWLNDNVTSPFSFFTGQAHILLPSELVTEPLNLKIAIAHEIQHQRQRDTLWIYFLEIINLLFAPNPLMKRLTQQTEELQELACDEALVGRKKISPAQYGQCLYAFAENQRLKTPKPIGAVGMAVKANQLKRRIELMFKHQRKTSKKAFIGASVIAVLMMACTAWAVQGTVSNQEISMSEAKILASRISENQEIPIVVDSAVLYWLNKAVESEQSRKYMRDSLERMSHYEAMIKAKFKKESLPLELLAVPLVESGYRNDVKSTSLAAGIWQFIPQTARRCGLEVSESQDERLNPNRITEAAICYYTKLYAIFQNWHVAISAYNIGERAMMNAIAEAGHNDVFQLAKEGHLGHEGKTYLPKVIAAMIILRNPELVE
jgi:beta-lactamase regulating signal transducer with metallopeptidase domain